MFMNLAVTSLNARRCLKRIFVDHNFLDPWQFLWTHKQKYEQVFCSHSNLYL